VEVINPFQRLLVDPKKFDGSFVDEIAPRMSVAVGLALRSFD
jgi:Tfp pilus assembly PilM family ATPase